jgi:hypothetical protein
MKLIKTHYRHNVELLKSEVSGPESVTKLIFSDSSSDKLRLWFMYDVRIY